MPAPPPAAVACQLKHILFPRNFAVPIKLVAAEAGFFLPDPLTLFEDILTGARRRRGYWKGQWHRAKRQDDQETLTVKRPQLRMAVDKQRMRGRFDVRDHSDQWNRENRRAVKAGHEHKSQSVRPR